MDRVLPTAITIAVVALVFGLMLRSWRRRQRRDGHLSAGYPAPADTAGPLVDVDAYYVATTPRDEPLERLAIAGLGFRSRARIAVAGQGLRLSLPGEDPVHIPGSAVHTLTPATMAIDRVVETDGLLRLGWALPDSGRAVDSYFRVIDPRDRAHLSDAIRSIAADPGAASESEA